MNKLCQTRLCHQQMRGSSGDGGDGGDGGAHYQNTLCHSFSRPELSLSLSNTSLEGFHCRNGHTAITPKCVWFKAYLFNEKLKRNGRKKRKLSINYRFSVRQKCMNWKSFCWKTSQNWSIKADLYLQLIIKKLDQEKTGKAKSGRTKRNGKINVAFAFS